MLKLKSMLRQYRADDYYCNAISKIWNRGMGRLTFVMLLEDDKKVLVNSTIARKKDYERVTEIFPEYTLVKVAYGYPLFYNYSMGWAYLHGFIEP